MSTAETGRDAAEDFLSFLRLRKIRHGFDRRVVMFTAHPDDEIIGAGGILRYIRDAACIVTATDGSPRDMRDARAAGFSSRKAYAAARISESRKALVLSGFDCRRRLRFGFEDQGLAFVLPRLALAVKDAITLIEPDVVLTHAFEGGHPDHDAVAFAVWAACSLMRNEINRSPRTVEFPTYHGDGVSGGMLFGFIPSAQRDALVVELDSCERSLKSRMMDCFVSQKNTLSLFTPGKEWFRKTPDHVFTDLPHEGSPLYDFHDWGIRSRMWPGLAEEAIESLHLGEVA